jgi:hypothetical protein
VSATKTCPYCGSAEIELVSPWGGQIITSQVRCLSCNTYFETIRDDFEAPVDATRAGDS